MDYELAKELKDAGFPQNSGLDGDYLDEKGKWCNPSLQLYDVFAPNLPSLIELVGGFNLILLSPMNCVVPNLLEETPFGIIKKDGETSDVWSAWFWHGADGEYGQGTTPEEAVARLWLALNRTVSSKS